MDDTISKIETELEEARLDLRQALSEVNQKVEAAEAQLQPEHIIERHPIAAVGAAAALGLLMGSKGRRSLAPATLIAGALIGLALRRKKR
jgi:ElaB/YqjD/DUF883 family membrane-anchored ribosome-binding protein